MENGLTMQKSKYKQDGGRCIWLMICSASSPNLTFQMLHTVGIECDECYTVAWRESKYTLIHLNRSKSIRLSKMKKAMASLESTYDVKGSSIMGYETLSSNDKETSVIEHPGFKRMVELLNARSMELESWLKEGDVFSNRKGLLWKFIEGTDPQLMTRVQLIDRVKKLSPLVVAQVTSTQALKPSSSHVRSVLLRYHYEKPVRNVMKEVCKMEKRLNASESSFDNEGEIYAAWNPMMVNLHKLGFTCKDAETRVRALQTAGVLEPFQLVRHSHVPNARWATCLCDIFSIPNLIFSQALRKSHAHLLPWRSCAQAQGVLCDLF